MGRRPAAPAENCPKRIGQTTGTGLGHWNLGLPVLLATVLLGTPLLAASPAEAADGWRNGLPPPGRLDYVVTRGGTDIGRNTVEFLRDGDGLVEFTFLVGPDADLTNETALGFNVGVDIDLLEVELGYDIEIASDSITLGPLAEFGAVLPVAEVPVFADTFKLDFIGGEYMFHA